jgi:hypothetical protein
MYPLAQQQASDEIDSNTERECKRKSRSKVRTSVPLSPSPTRKKRTSAATEKRNKRAAEAESTDSVSEPVKVKRKKGTAEDPGVQNRFVETLQRKVAAELQAKTILQATLAELQRDLKVQSNLVKAHQNTESMLELEKVTSAEERNKRIAVENEKVMALTQLQETKATLETAKVEAEVFRQISSQHKDSLLQSQKELDKMRDLNIQLQISQASLSTENKINIEIQNIFKEISVTSREHAVADRDAFFQFTLKVMQK